MGGSLSAKYMLQFSRDGVTPPTPLPVSEERVWLMIPATIRSSNVILSDTYASSASTSTLTSSSSSSGDHAPQVVTSQKSVSSSSSNGSFVSDDSCAPLVTITIWRLNPEHKLSKEYALKLPSGTLDQMQSAATSSPRQHNNKAPVLSGSAEKGSAVAAKRDEWSPMTQTARIMYAQGSLFRQSKRISASVENFSPTSEPDPSAPSSSTSSSVTVIRYTHMESFCEESELLLFAVGRYLPLLSVPALVLSPEKDVGCSLESSQRQQYRIQNRLVYPRAWTVSELLQGLCDVAAQLEQLHVEGPAAHRNVSWNTLYMRADASFNRCPWQLGDPQYATDGPTPPLPDAAHYIRDTVKARGNTCGTDAMDLLFVPPEDRQTVPGALKKGSDAILPKDSEYTESFVGASDVFAFGTLIVTLLSGGGIDMSKKSNDHLENNTILSSLRAEMRQAVEQLQRFSRECTAVNPQERPRRLFERFTTLPVLKQCSFVKIMTKLDAFYGADTDRHPDTTSFYSKSLSGPGLDDASSQERLLFFASLHLDCYKIPYELLVRRVIPRLLTDVVFDDPCAAPFLPHLLHAVDPAVAQQHRHFPLLLTTDDVMSENANASLDSNADFDPADSSTYTPVSIPGAGGNGKKAKAPASPHQHSPNPKHKRRSSQAGGNADTTSTEGVNSVLVHGILLPSDYLPLITRCIRHLLPPLAVYHREVALAAAMKVGNSSSATDAPPVSRKIGPPPPPLCTQRCTHRFVALLRNLSHYVYELDFSELNECVIPAVIELLRHFCVDVALEALQAYSVLCRLVEASFAEGVESAELREALRMLKNAADQELCALAAGLGPTEHIPDRSFFSLTSSDENNTFTIEGEQLEEQVGGLAGIGGGFWGGAAIAPSLRRTGMQLAVQTMRRHALQDHMTEVEQNQQLIVMSRPRAFICVRYAFSSLAKFWHTSFAASSAENLFKLQILAERSRSPSPHPVGSGGNTSRMLNTVEKYRVLLEDAAGFDSWSVTVLELLLSLLTPLQTSTATTSSSASDNASAENAMDEARERDRNTLIPPNCRFTLGGFTPEEACEILPILMIFSDSASNLEQQMLQLETVSHDINSAYGECVLSPPRSLEPENIVVDSQNKQEESAAADQQPSCDETSTAVASAGSGSPQDGVKERLIRFYEKYNPEKLGSIEATLSKFEGKEDTLFKALVSKYGPEPVKEDEGASGVESALSENNQEGTSADDTGVTGNETEQKDAHIVGTNSTDENETETVSAVKESDVQQQQQASKDDLNQSDDNDDRQNYTHAQPSIGLMQKCSSRQLLRLHIQDLSAALASKIYDALEKVGAASLVQTVSPASIEFLKLPGATSTSSASGSSQVTNKISGARLSNQQHSAQQLNIKATMSSTETAAARFRASEAPRTTGPSAFPAVMLRYGAHRAIVTEPVTTRPSDQKGSKKLEHDTSSQQKRSSSQLKSFKAGGGGEDVMHPSSIAGRIGIVSRPKELEEWPWCGLRPPPTAAAAAAYNTTHPSGPMMQLPHSEQNPADFKCSLADIAERFFRPIVRRQKSKIRVTSNATNGEETEDDCSDSEGADRQNENERVYAAAMAAVASLSESRAESGTHVPFILDTIDIDDWLNTELPLSLKRIAATSDMAMREAHVRPNTKQHILGAQLPWRRTRLAAAAAAAGNDSDTKNNQHKSGRRGRANSVGQFFNDKASNGQQADETKSSVPAGEKSKRRRTAVATLELDTDELNGSGEDENKSSNLKNSDDQNQNNKTTTEPTNGHRPADSKESNSERSMNSAGLRVGDDGMLIVPPIALLPRLGPVYTGMSPKERLKKIYAKHMPEKLAEINTILDAFKDREEEMFVKLRSKFGDEAVHWEAEEAAQPALERLNAARLYRFYMTYGVMDKIADIPKIINQFMGKEKTMWKLLTIKYGLEPEDPPIAGFDDGIDAARRPSKSESKTKSKSIKSLPAAEGVQEEASKKDKASKNGKESTTDTTIATEKKTIEQQQTKPVEKPKLDQNQTRLKNKQDAVANANTFTGISLPSSVVQAKDTQNNDDGEGADGNDDASAKIDEIAKGLSDGLNNQYQKPTVGLKTRRRRPAAALDAGDNDSVSLSKSASSVKLEKTSSLSARDLTSSTAALPPTKTPPVVEVKKSISSEWGDSSTGGWNTASGSAAHPTKTTAQPTTISSSSSLAAAKSSNTSNLNNAGGWNTPSTSGNNGGGGNGWGTTKTQAPASVGGADGWGKPSSSSAHQASENGWGSGSAGGGWGGSTSNSFNPAQSQSAAAAPNLNASGSRQASATPPFGVSASPAPPAPVRSTAMTSSSSSNSLRARPSVSKVILDHEAEDL